MFNNKIKLIDSQFNYNLGGGFEVSHKTIEYNNKIYMFTVFTEYQNIFIFDKKDFIQTFKKIREIECKENCININDFNLCDFITCYYWDIVEENILKYETLPLINNDKDLYNKEYLNLYLNTEIKKYFDIVIPYDEIIKNLQANDNNGTYDEIIKDNEYNYINSILELKETLINDISIYNDDIEVSNFYKYQLNLLNESFNV